MWLVIFQVRRFGAIASVLYGMGFSLATQSLQIQCKTATITMEPR